MRCSQMFTVLVRSADQILLLSTDCGSGTISSYKQSGPFGRIAQFWIGDAASWKGERQQVNM
jgi:hypothetical protein